MMVSADLIHSQGEKKKETLNRVSFKKIRNVISNGYSLMLLVLVVGNKHKL